MEKCCDKREVRPNIALLIDNLFDKYCQSIWKSVFEAAEEYDLNIVGFVGGPLSPYRYGKAIYDLIDPQFFDGIIIVTGSLVWGSTKEELEAFCKRFLPIPVVSISAPIEGLTNILVDNDKGMRQLIEHLLRDHHYQRIAFINGPKENSDAAARFDSYQKTLEKYGIPYDPSLVVDGEMDRESGARAIRTLLDERKVAFDAIVGANDNMTLYAMQELQWRGIKVPEEVGVGGFDDIGEDLTCYPTLTTVRQPFREMGLEAVRSMQMLLDGKSVDEYQYLPTEIVIRGSCGCGILQEFSNLFSEPNSAAFSQGIPSVDDLVTAVQTKYPQQVVRVKNKAIIQAMAQALIDEINMKDQGRFLRVLVKVIADERENGMNTVFWPSIVSAMADKLPINGADGERQVIINRIIKDSFALMGMVAEEIQNFYRFKYESGNIIINRRFPHTILSEENAVEKLIMEDYVRLGIDSFYLMQYCDSTRKQSILKYYFDQGNHIVVDPETSSFPSIELIPGHFKKDGVRYSYIVIPVHFREEQFGYYLCRNNKLDPFFYETIANQLGMAIKVTTLIQEVNQYATDLEKRVLERTKELKEAQQQLVETAHKAGMAEIAVGVVHNVGNLLNSINVAAACISDVVRCSKIDNLRKANEIFRSNQEEINRDLPDESKVRLLPNYYERIGNALKVDLVNIQGEITGIEERITLILSIIETLQEYIGGNYNNLYQENADLKKIIEGALKIQENSIRKNKIDVIKEFAEIQSFPIQSTKLTHILVNLIKNAIEAMESTPVETRVLKISLFDNTESNPVIRIADRGVGIDSANLRKVFTFGYTTKEHGHGFGLHTCANQIKEMGGSITVQSDGPGKGATFTLILPKN